MTSDIKWVMVPAEPTPEMVEAGLEFIGAAAYRAMLSAAPPVPGGEVVAWRYRYNGQWYLSQDKSFALQGFDLRPLYATPPTAEEITRRAREETAKKLASHLRLIADSMEERGSGFYPGDLREIADALLVEMGVKALAKPPGETGAGWIG